MKLTLQTQVRQTVEVDVTFPLYRQQDVSADHGPTHIIYERITPGSDGGFLVTRIGHRGRAAFDVEVDQPYRFDHSELDYTLGRGEYGCTPEQWVDIVAALTRTVHAIP